MQPADSCYLSLSTENSIVVPSRTPSCRPRLQVTTDTPNCWYGPYHVSFFPIKYTLRGKLLNSSDIRGFFHLNKWAIGIAFMVTTNRSEPLEHVEEACWTRCVRKIWNDSYLHRLYIFRSKVFQNTCLCYEQNSFDVFWTLKHLTLYLRDSNEKY